MIRLKWWTRFLVLVLALALLLILILLILLLFVILVLDLLLEDALLDDHTLLGLEESEGLDAPIAHVALATSPLDYVLVGAVGGDPSTGLAGRPFAVADLLEVGLRILELLVLGGLDVLPVEVGALLDRLVLGLDLRWNTCI